MWKKIHVTFHSNIKQIIFQLQHFKALRTHEECYYRPGISKVYIPGSPQIRFTFRVVNPASDLDVLSSTDIGHSVLNGAHIEQNRLKNLLIKPIDNAVNVLDLLDSSVILKLL
ncbi:uncharacterized protein PHALS_06140 [Plasmopara halstedii]|uniref:Uncharacterized protein n=1 Tax=Plasmopara halstedii TaxID=4781 RepID=A0A0P1B243_PLAHL|nr:uncharacterized protein PHALS_06140 [Plasmopara halstedii]CEG48311.1 hypothetical protein PHALS_06140 [Plasmopara halstedii]|eukprot:XP_024584680.1 hypothetical protein PHALS_06140 [Plasmopara halstedii]